MMSFSYFFFLFCFLDAGIDCFKCVSLEWQNRACDDPFHNNFSSGLLESPCMGGRKGRNGLFPATACIKLTGYYRKFCLVLFFFFVPLILLTKHISNNKRTRLFYTIRKYRGPVGEIILKRHSRDCFRLGNR